MSAFGSGGRRARRITPLLALLLLGILAFSGEATKPCGTFRFTGEPEGQALPFRLTFKIKPKSCGADPTVSSEIPFVQIVRVRNLTTGEFEAPQSEDSAWMTDSPIALRKGWAVDKGMFVPIGYFGVDRNGDETEHTTFGSDKVTAMMDDIPSRRGTARFEGLSVPVCRKGDELCLNRVLGYALWGFEVTDGIADKPWHAKASTAYRDVFDGAVEKWNSVASARRIEALPTFKRMP